MKKGEIRKVVCEVVVSDAKHCSRACPSFRGDNDYAQCSKAFSMAEYEKDGLVVELQRKGKKYLRCHECIGSEITPSPKAKKARK